MFRHLLTASTRTPGRRALAVVASFVAVSAVGTLDSVTGSALSFAAFYVLVIVAATVAVGATVGILAALWSAVLWGIADVLTGRSDAAWTVHLWNGVTRFVVHGTVALLVTALVRALHSARASEARSRSFLAAAAHQIRTPVAALSASVEALLLQGATKEQERLLAAVAGETARLGRLVASLLRTARLDQGEPLRPVRVDIVKLCEEELDRARQLSAVEWHLIVRPGAPRHVVLDPGAASESLGNILDNARRHAVSSVRVTMARDHDRIAVEVIDDGPGLPAGAEAQAFDRFVTLDGQGGTGLGLAIARELARRHGGEIVYANKAFVLTLPIVDEDSTVRGLHGVPGARSEREPTGRRVSAKGRDGDPSSDDLAEES